MPTLNELKIKKINKKNVAVARLSATDGAKISNFSLIHRGWCHLTDSVLRFDTTSNITKGDLSVTKKLQFSEQLLFCELL